MSQTQTCKHCGAPIIFLLTIKNTYMPCDSIPVYFSEDPSAKAIILTVDGRTTRGIKSDTYDPQRHQLGYIPHWANCKRNQKSMHHLNEHFPEYSNTEEESSEKVPNHI